MRTHYICTRKYLRSLKKNHLQNLILTNLFNLDYSIFARQQNKLRLDIIKK